MTVAISSAASCTGRCGRRSNARRCPIDSLASFPFRLEKSVVPSCGPSEIDRPIVLASSKLTAIKGADVLLRAAAIYSKLLEQPLTVIAGEGDERAALEALRDELNLHDDVIFLGQQNAEQMVELCNAADVTVLASRTDWFPLVGIESLACGTPVIASDVGGLSQLVTSNIGRLFSAGDYATLSALVTDFIRSNFKETAQAACVQHVREKFSWDRTVDRILAIYQDVPTTTHNVPCLKSFHV